MSWRLHPTPRECPKADVASFPILEVGVETMRQATIAARSATHALQSVTAICLDLTQVDEILTDEQRSARSKLISDVLLSQKLT